MEPTILSAGEVCQILALEKKVNGKKVMQPFPFRTLDEWVNQGHVRPFREARGRGAHRLFRTVPDVLALACGYWLRESGLSIETAVGVMKVVGEFSEEDIRAAFKKGRTWFVAIDNSAMPRLITEEAMRGSILDFEKKNDSIFHPFGIGLSDTLQVIESRIEALKKEEQKRSKAKAGAK